MNKKTSPKIPGNIFFVWFGESLPWTARLSLLSAMDKCKPAKLQLIHQGLQGMQNELTDFFAYPGFEMLEADDHWFEGGSMQTAGNLFRELKPPAARSNLLRLAVLYKQGGIYLDTDTITLKSFDSLGHFSGYCGLEALALPSELYQSINPLKWLRAGLLLTLRDICTRIPRGYRAFATIEKYYTPSANNAVMGSLPGNPLIARAFEMMSELSEADQGRRFRLGTHLLQRLSGNHSSQDMQVLKSDYFYPLGPEISTHLFKKGSAAYVNDMLKPDTLTVHWYQSVFSRLYPNGVTLKELQQQNTAFAKLAEPYADKLNRAGA